MTMAGLVRRLISVNVMEDVTVGSLYDRCTALYSEKVALKYNNKQFSFSELNQKSINLCGSLKKIGFYKNDKAAFLMQNCIEYIICIYALAKLGMVKVPLAVLLGSEAHIYMMNEAECKVLFYHIKMVQKVQEMTPSLRTVSCFICISDDPNLVPKGHLHFQSLIDNNEQFSYTEIVQADDLSSIYYTGGTTGLPKGVMLSHRAWVFTYLLEMLELGLDTEERFAFFAPLTHAAGCFILPVLLKKGVCVIGDRFSPENFFNMVEQEKITSTFLVPTMIYSLIDYPRKHKYNLSSLKNVIYGASRISTDRLKEAIKIFGPIFTQLYGQTEAPNMISILPKDEHVISDPKKEKRIFSSCGRPSVLCDVKIINNGKEVKRGKNGEIVVLCPNLMDGYLNKPEATKETIRGGWLYTGDIGHYDHDGYLFILDRSKDMIISGGFNIFPKEIEDVLFEHPAVNNAAVIGVPDDKWGEAVKAIVVLNQDLEISEEELISFVKKRKGSLIAPKSIDFWDEIPLTNLGKVDKKKIRNEYSGIIEQSVGNNK